MNNFERFKNKTVLVTGGSSGIGQAIAIRFGTEGANVVINYHSSQIGAEHTKEEIDKAVQNCSQVIRDAGSQALIVQADVSQEADVQRMMKEATTAFGRIDIVVNNAGIQYPEDTHKVEMDGWDRVMNTNIRGAFICGREALRHFLDNDIPGVMINVSSVHQIIPKPRFVSYSMSKGAMQNMTRTMALEYASQGIRVNGVAPGATITPINQAWIDDPNKLQQVAQHIPLNRASLAEEQASLVAFLASDEAAYITGQTIFADGGLTLYGDFRYTWSSE